MSARLGIIGGYLGAGKSTLVNRLLTRATLGRTAVVVNDFGSVNIDADLIASADDDTIALTNGCICCQATDDAARTMTALAARSDLEHVLCEVSGVGDPGQLAAWREYPGFAPGPVLVCADATRVPRLLRDPYVGDTVARQLASADVVLVTKTDLVGPDQLDEAVDACAEVAVGAQVVRQSAAEPEASAAEVFAGWSPGAAGSGQGRARGASGDGGATDGDEHPSVHESETLTAAGRVDVPALVRALTALPEVVVRAKGVLRGRDGYWHEVHLAGGRVEERRLSAGRPATSPSSLVLIAAGPDAAHDLARARAVLLPVLA